MVRSYDWRKANEYLRPVIMSYFGRRWRTARIYGMNLNLKRIISQDVYNLALSRHLFPLNCLEGAVMRVPTIPSNRFPLRSKFLRQ